jgi:diadenosine tetraphosphate (Ap4A) HIT family hydrolase
VVKVSGAVDYNVLQNNGAPAHQAVMHVHFHIIPKPNQTAGLGVQWPSAALSNEDAPRLASELRAAVLGG